MLTVKYSISLEQFFYSFAVEKNIFEAWGEKPVDHYGYYKLCIILFLLQML